MNHALKQEGAEQILRLIITEPAHMPNFPFDNGGAVGRSFDHRRAEASDVAGPCEAQS